MALQAQIVQATQTIRVIRSSISERWRATLPALPFWGAAAFASLFAAALATPVIPENRARRAACPPPLDTRGPKGHPSKGGLWVVNA